MSQKDINAGDVNPSDKKDKACQWISGIGLVCIILGVLGLLLPFFNNFLIQRNMESVDLASMSAEELSENRGTATQYPLSDIEEISLVSFWPQLGCYETDEIVGELIVPSVGIDLAIFNTASNENLLAGVGELYVDREMGRGNYVLSGHRANGKGNLLHDLMDVEIGDLVYVTDKNTVYSYRVLEAVKKDNDAVYMLNDSAEPMLTLMTCYKGRSSARWFVLCTLESSAPYEGFEFVSR